MAYTILAKEGWNNPTTQRIHGYLERLTDEGVINYKKIEHLYLKRKDDLNQHRNLTPEVKKTLEEVVKDGAEYEIFLVEFNPHKLLDIFGNLKERFGISIIPELIEPLNQNTRGIYCLSSSSQE